MYQHTCARAGAEGCGWSTTAATEEELRAELADIAQADLAVLSHARDRHQCRAR